MKILHVTECFAGGVSRAVSRIPDLAPEHEHILLAHGDDIRSELALPFSDVYKLPKGFTRRLRAVRDVSLRSGVDLVHAHSSWAGVYCRTQQLPAPVIYQPHGYAIHKGGKLQGRLFYLAEKLLSQRSASTVVLSPHEGQIAMMLNAKANAVYLPNVPSQPIVSARALFEKRPKNFTVVTIGRICEQKDPTYFAEVAKKVRESDPAIRFTWIGDGDPTLRKALESNNIRVTGWIEGDRLLEHLDEAALYIHTARYEGFPLSVLDAAARQVPIVVRDIPAFKGTRLKSVESAQEMAISILAAVTSEVEAQTLLEGGQSLLDDMNEENQREALRLLYSSYETNLMGVAQ